VIPGEFKRWLKIGGRLMAVAAFVFIGLALHRQWDALRQVEIGRQVWLVVAGLAVTYGCALMLVAEVWHRLISDFAAARFPRRLTLPSYALSQLAKYIPGNVFQYVGRHGRMARAGVANAPLLRAVTSDIIVLLLAAALTASCSYLLFPIRLPMLSDASARLALVAAVVVIAALAAATIAVPRLARFIRKTSPRRATLAAVIPLMMVFFAIQGVTLVSLAGTITGAILPQLATVAVLSWIAGVLPLGAPAGLGTREATILLLAGPLVGSANSLLLAALFRLVTTFGDIVCFGLGWAISRRSLRLHRGDS
jgi:hypothetical protein